MAIIQISKIQQRSGNLVDLPQLDEAEFGWASDASRLFIGKTQVGGNIENVEVLTSYSNISFSQLDGADGGNLNINNASNGEVLTYDGVNWTNRGGNTGGLINLGNVSNVKILGGGIGYVLETDSTGNLSWTPKGTLYTNIIAISNATPMVMTVNANTPYTNSQEITISGVTAANANSIVNGNTFYVELSNDYPTSGNVFLYTNSTLTTPADGTNLGQPTANGVATAVFAGGSAGAAGGSTTMIQYNNTNVFDGSPNFTFDFNNNIMALNGNANVGNLNANGIVTSTRFVSNIGTGSAPLTVSSTTKVANLNADLLDGYDSSSSATPATIALRTGDGSLIANLLYGNIGTNAQPFITSLGTLSALNVTGAATITGNMIINASSSSLGLTVNGFAGNDAQRINFPASSTGLSIYRTTDANNSDPFLILGTNTHAGHLAVRAATGGWNPGVVNGDMTIISRGTTTDTGAITIGSWSSSGRFMRMNSNGQWTIGAASTGDTLTVNGTANISGTLQTTTITTGSSGTSGTITGNWTLTSGSRLQATYADLAEYYQADKQYEPGTVLEFGGEHEVTIASDGTTRVAGVVSTNPAYAMNMNCPGIAVAIALQGRVPVKVRGKINKGDMMISSGNGYARSSNQPNLGSVIGKALENFNGDEGVIEIAIGRL